VGKPCFNGWLYATNALVPPLPLKQVDTWIPSDDRGGRLVRWWTVAMQVVGWVLAGAVVAAIARLYARRVS